jgi:hypothetical protein
MGFESFNNEPVSSNTNENPHMKSAESRDERIGQLRIYLDTAEKQKAGFEELLAHRSEPDYVLTSEATKNAKVSSFNTNESEIQRQIELQDNLIGDYNREIKELTV